MEDCGIKAYWITYVFEKISGEMSRIGIPLENSIGSFAIPISQLPNLIIPFRLLSNTVLLTENKCITPLFLF